MRFSRVAGAVISEAWRHRVPAHLVLWYAGMEGGHALADVLTGRHNPSGRLPFSVPTSEEHLPAFDRDATSVTYDRFHGQRLLDRLDVDPAFPHGFGLSYTTFSIVDAGVVGAGADGPRLRVTVRNTGSRAGDTVVQLYARDEEASVVRPVRQLVAFERVALDVGEEKTIELSAPVARLAFTGLDDRRLIEAGRVTLTVGFASDDIRATSEVEILGSVHLLRSSPAALPAEPRGRHS